MSVSYPPLIFESPFIYRQQNVEMNLRQAGCFSLDANGDFRDDNSSLKILQLPPSTSGLRWNLDIANDLAVPYSWKNDQKGIFSWIAAHHRDDDFVTPNFTGNRQYLTKIMATLYDVREAWQFGISRFQGVYYIRSFSTGFELDRCFEELPGSRPFQMTRWGYKFQQYMAPSYADGTSCNPEKPSNENKAYNAVISALLGDIKLLYSADINCGLESEQESGGDFSRYVSLKTCVHGRDSKLSFYRHKTRDWWRGAFLTGSSTVWCGMRNDEGIVDSIKRYSLSTLVEQGSAFWKPNICLYTLYKTLQFIQNSMSLAEDLDVWLFEYKPRNTSGLEKCQITATSIDLEEHPGFCVLPKWFIAQMENL